MANGFQIDVPGGGWQAANQGLSDIGAGLGQWARQQQALQLAERQRQNELQDAIMLFKMKADYERQNKSPLESYLEKAKLAEGAMTMGDERLYRLLTEGKQDIPFSGNTQPFQMPQTFNRVEKSLTGGLPNGLSLMPQGSFGGERPFSYPASDYQMIPAEFNRFGDPIKFKQELRPEVEIKRKAEEQATIASEKEKQVNATKVSRLNNIIDIIEKEYEKTKTPSGFWGPARRFGENISKGLQFTPNQRQDKAYHAFVGGVRAQLARAMGDVGNLSEYEQKSVMDLVPTLGDDPQTAALKIQNLRTFVAEIQAAAGMPSKQQNTAPSAQPSGNSSSKNGFSYLWE